jgi:hypothetical protein
MVTTAFAGIQFGIGIRTVRWTNYAVKRVMVHVNA